MRNARRHYNRKKYSMTAKTYARLTRNGTGPAVERMDPEQRIELFECLISTGCVSAKKAIGLQAEIVSLRAQMAGQPAAD